MAAPRCWIPSPDWGLSLLIEGGADAGALTVKINWPEDCPSGLMTSTVQVAAVVVKFRVNGDRRAAEGADRAVGIGPACRPQRYVAT